MRFPRIATFVLLLLASASVAEAADYARLVDACRFVSLPSAERPACCDLASKDRFTRVGGDCCKSLFWEASEPAADVAHGHEVPPALFALRALAPLPAPGRVSECPPNPFARGPPARPVPTENIVLRI